MENKMTLSEPEIAGQENWRSRVKTPRREVAVFSRHLSVMLQGGVPLTRCLECLTQQEKFPNFGVVVDEIGQAIAEGHSLSESVAPFSRTFPPLYSRMLKVGESSGQLTVALDRLANWLEQDEKTFQKIKQAITYPVIVLISGFLLTLGVFCFVIPEFVVIFSDLKVPLPFLTQIVLLISALARNPGAWLLAMMIGSGSYYALKQSASHPVGAMKLYGLLLAIPVVGSMVKCASLARLSSAAEMATANGLSLAPSLDLAFKASQNPLILNDLDGLQSSLSSGLSLSEHMRINPTIFDPVLIQVVIGGEESASLDRAFAQATNHYDSEVYIHADRLGAVLEPLLLMGVAFVIGLLLLSVFLPLYSLISAI